MAGFACAVCFPVARSRPQRPNSVHDAAPLMSFQEDQIEGHTQTGERNGNVKPGPDYRRCEKGEGKKKIWLL